VAVFQVRPAVEQHVERHDRHGQRRVVVGRVRRGLIGNEVAHGRIGPELGQSRRGSDRRADELDGVLQPVEGDLADEVQLIERMRLEGDDLDLARVARRRAEAVEAEMRADVQEDVARLEMGVEEGAGRILEAGALGL